MTQETRNKVLEQHRKFNEKMSDPAHQAKLRATIERLGIRTDGAEWIKETLESTERLFQRDLDDNTEYYLVKTGLGNMVNVSEKPPADGTAYIYAKGYEDRELKLHGLMDTRNIVGHDCWMCAVERKEELARTQGI
jgi:hypothetical protein